MTMTIGIVLSSLPGYSETFFRNKIKGLKSRGYKVVLFVDYTTHKSDLKFYRGARNYKSFILLHLLSVSFVLFKLLLFSPYQILNFIRLERKDNKGGAEIIKSLYFNSHILRHRLDWLHFGFATKSIEGENVAKAIGAKMAISVRGFDIAIYPLKNPGCYITIWDKVDKIHVISNDLQKKLYTNGFKGEVPVVKITPAIDISNFYFNRKDYLGNDVVNILSVGRLHWKKGFEYGFKALAILKSRGYKFRYTVIGAGEIERYKFTVYQLGLNKEVCFKGVLKPAEISDELKKADLYLQPSIQEGFCNAVLEAQAAGCLCIVSDAEGLSENVLHEKTGWVVKRRSVEELVEKIEYVINLLENRKMEIINTSQKRVIEEFNIDKQIQEFIDFYEN